MHKISLLDINDLEEAYEIEVSTQSITMVF